MNHIKRVDNHPFDVSKTPYLPAIFNDTARKMVVRKASQIRLSITVICRFLYRIITKQYNGIYYFPTDSALYTFSQSRIQPMIERNPALKEYINSNSVNNTTARQIGENFAYFFGLKGATQKESTPADCEVFDEYDLMGPKDVEIALERMQDSPHKFLDIIGNPSIPDYGTDGEFKLSDMKFWTNKCDHCGHWNTFDVKSERMPFPECIDQGFLCCVKCRGKLDVLSKNQEWVADYPDRDTSGYAMTRLMAFNAEHPRLLEQYKRAVNPANFYNRVLGIPYSDASTKLEAPQVFALCDPDLAILHEQNLLGATAGIDINPAAGHRVVVSRPGKNKQREYVHFGRYPNMEEVETCLKRLCVSNFVCDILPDTEGVKRLIKNMKKGWGCRYNEGTGNYNWNEDEKIVSVNRTESIDSSHRAFLQGLFSIPRRCSEVEEFVDECCSVARILEKNEKTGNMTARWIELSEQRPDHYRQAINYDMLLWVGHEFKAHKPGIVRVTSNDLYKPKPQSGGRIQLGW
jgi:hypothetical protein